MLNLILIFVIKFLIFNFIMIHSILNKLSHHRKRWKIFFGLTYSLQTARYYLLRFAFKLSFWSSNLSWQKKPYIEQVSIKYLQLLISHSYASRRRKSNEITNSFQFRLFSYRTVNGKNKYWEQTLRINS